MRKLFTNKLYGLDHENPQLVKFFETKLIDDIGGYIDHWDKVIDWYMKQEIYYFENKV